MDYSELKLKIADWLHRTDLTSQIPDFIRLAESRINRLLDTQLTEVSLTVPTVANSRTVDIPANYSVPIAIWNEEYQPRNKLIYVDLTALVVNNSLTGIPNYWTHDNGKIAFERKCDKIYPLTFQYKANVELSDSVPTNNILTNFPDLYIYGSLLESAPYVRDVQMIGVWQDRFDRAIVEINNEEGRKKSLATLGTEFSRKSTFNIYRGF